MKKVRKHLPPNESQWKLSVDGKCYFFFSVCLFVSILIVLNEGKTFLEKLLLLFIIFIPNNKDTLHWFFEELERARKR